MRTLTINAQSYQTEALTLRYEELVAIAGMTGRPSMMWRRSDPECGGILLPGDRIDVADGLIINAAHTTLA